MLKLMIKLKIFFISRKAKKYFKKSFFDPQKYSLYFRNDYLVRKINSLIKNFNVEISVKGHENLGNNGPAMLYGNHQDNFDAFAVIYALQAQSEAKDDLNKIPTFIAKHSLQYKSYTRNILNSIDTFFLDRDNIRKSLDTMDQFSKFVKNNKTYGVIFPEGTRNKEGGISTFKPGSFKIPKKEMIPIIPFTINNSVGALDFERKETLKVEIIFHKKITPHSFATQTTVALSERVEKIVSSAFKKPQYQFKDSEIDSDIENSKSAIKWRKKEAKRIEAQRKKEQKQQKEEQKIVEQQNKQYEKYEKKLNKKQKKQ